MITNRFYSESTVLLGRVPYSMSVMQESCFFGVFFSKTVSLCIFFYAKLKAFYIFTNRPILVAFA